MKKIIAPLSIIALCTLGSFMLAQPAKPAGKETGAAKSKASTPNEHKIFTPADLQWGDAPPSLPPGAKMAVLEGDPTKPGPFTVRLQAPAGYKIPPHTHPTAERVTVISGSFHVGMGDKMDEAAAQNLPPGSFVLLPAGMKHYAFGTEEGIVQINSTGPFQINYVNPADDPRKTKK